MSQKSSKIIKTPSTLTTSLLILLIFFVCTHNITINTSSVLSVIAVIKVTSGELFVEGGGLPGRFRTAQFHFHWGRSDSGGSEHTLNGRRYPLEAITWSSNTFFLIIACFWIHLRDSVPYRLFLCFTHYNGWLPL